MAYMYVFLYIKDTTVNSSIVHKSNIRQYFKRIKKKKLAMLIYIISKFNTRKEFLINKMFLYESIKRNTAFQ